MSSQQTWLSDAVGAAAIIAAALVATPACRAGGRAGRRLHPREWTGTGRHSRSPRAGGHPHDLVQSRRRRRDAGQVGAGAFPRASDVQGHREESGRRNSRRSSPASAARKTPSPRTTTPAIYQRVPSEKLKTVMEFEADRMTGLQLTDQVVLPERDVILEERNSASRTIRARGSASRSTPRCSSIIPTASR